MLTDYLICLRDAKVKNLLKSNLLMYLFNIFMQHKLNANITCVTDHRMYSVRFMANFAAWRSFSSHQFHGVKNSFGREATSLLYFHGVILIQRSSHYHAKSEINPNQGEHGEKF